MPESIKEVIKIDRSVTLDQDINTAIFYSISNCQEGLSGISFGNFLIKNVAHQLKQEIEGSIGLQHFPLHLVLQNGLKKILSIKISKRIFFSSKHWFIYRFRQNRWISQ